MSNQWFVVTRKGPALESQLLEAKATKVAAKVAAIDRYDAEFPPLGEVGKPLVRVGVTKPLVRVEKPLVRVRVAEPLVRVGVAELLVRVEVAEPLVRVGATINFPPMVRGFVRGRLLGGGKNIADLINSGEGAQCSVEGCCSVISSTRAFADI